MTERWKIERGDSLAIVPKMGQVDAVVTDPPYSRGSKRKEWRSGGSVEAALFASAQKVKEGGLMLVFSASSGRSIERIVSAVAPVIPFGRTLSWCKPHSRCAAAGPFGWQTVLILVFGSMGGPSRARDHIVCPAKQYKRQGTSAHPAELPMEVATWLSDGLVSRVPEGSTVLDPFAGTGTLLEPFWRRGCNCVGVEIQDKWANLAENRLG